jgi:hypothetical protein
MRTGPRERSFCPDSRHLLPIPGFAKTLKPNAITLKISVFIAVFFGLRLFPGPFIQEKPEK